MINIKKIYILLFLIYILILTAGCSSIVKLGSVTGIVTLDGTPSDNITVSAAGSSATTNASGSYTISGILGGSVTITASKSGYTSQSTTVNVTGGSSVTAPTLNLISSGSSLSGTVRLYEETDYSDITVEIVERNLSTTTDIQGSYSFSNLDAGSITLLFTRTGYEEVTYNATLVNNQTTIVPVVILTPETGGSITGYAVYNDNPSDYSGITVAVSGNSSLSTTTDANGSFTISNVPSGTQTLIISRTGYATRLITGITVESGESSDAGTTPIYPEYNMSTFSGTIQSMTQLNGYLYKVSSTNPTTIVDYTEVTNNYESMMAGLLYSSRIGATLNMIGGMFVNSYFQLYAYNESLELVDWLSDTDNIEVPPAVTHYDTASFYAYGFSNFIHIAWGPSFIATYNVNETGIISLDYVNNHFYACNSTAFYKYDNFTADYPTPYSVTVEPLGGGTDLIGIAYIDPYIWLIDRTTKRLMKILDDSG